MNDDHGRVSSFRCKAVVCEGSLPITEEDAESMGVMMLLSLDDEW